MSTKSVLICLAVAAALFFGWKLTSSSAYESAEYTVLEKNDAFEIREYPDLMLAATNMNADRRREDGSFMRLFRYISGDNDNSQKVAMTTPVFMESEADSNDGQMGFVLPAEVASSRVPEPNSERVEIKKRTGGLFAVIRFNGRMNRQSVDSAEASLREWIASKGLVAADQFESAGYDPPWTPGHFRRNEVLIRLLPTAEATTQQSESAEIDKSHGVVNLADESK